MQIVTVRLIGATIITVIGIAAFIIARDYDLGAARRMGPGYFPTVLSVILVLLGMIEVVSSLMKPEVEKLDWRPMIAILAAVAGFAFAMYFFGLIPAFFVVIGLSTLSERGFGWKPSLILAVATSLGAWLLFSQFLGMTMPLLQFGP